MTPRPHRDIGGDDVAFLACRPRLMGVAYGMLGTTGEAEDVVQDAWLRWRAADRQAVRDAEGFLVRATTRLALDRIGSARARRETYVGPWLPEPLLADERDDPQHGIEAAERMSLALLMALERLDPVQRAVLLLRDVFDLDYDDIADAVEKAPANCRQIARRARERVGEPGTRFRVSPGSEEQLIRAFTQAVLDGDLAGLKELLAADAVLWADGGGVVVSARRPIAGADRIARFLIGVRGKMPEDTQMRWVRVNGDPGVALSDADGVFSVLTIEPGEQAIANVRIVNNPHKLAHLVPPP